MRITWTLVGLFGCFSFLTACDFEGSLSIDDPKTCPDNYDPVCGVDDRTYSNACRADHAGVEIVHEGRCAIACTDEWAPVCGMDGRTYGNPCEARAAGVEINYEGECGGWGCPEIWAPVCGEDGVTYANECEANRAGVRIAYHDECETGIDECKVDADCGEGFSCLTVCTGGDPGGGPLRPPVPMPEPDPDGTVPGPMPPIEDPGCWNVCEPDGGPICPAIACAVDCPNGYVTDDAGCATCECLPGHCGAVYEPVCGADGQTYGNECEADAARVEILHEGECDPVACDVPACDLHCENGFKTDEFGCATCECVEPLQCAPVLCKMACEFGFAQDAAGCDICECAQPAPSPDPVPGEAK